MSSAAARPALSVMLIVSDADAAMRWYTTALGAGRLWDLGGVAGLDLGGAPFFVHEAVPGKNREPSPTAVGLTTTRIEVFIDEPDELIERAAQAGATDVEPVSAHDTPWGRPPSGRLYRSIWSSLVSGRPDPTATVSQAVVAVSLPAVVALRW